MLKAKEDELAKEQKMLKVINLEKKVPAAIWNYLGLFAMILGLLGTSWRHLRLWGTA